MLNIKEELRIIGRGGQNRNKRGQRRQTTLKTKLWSKCHSILLMGIRGKFHGHKELYTSSDRRSKEPLTASKNNNKQNGN